MLPADIPPPQTAIVRLHPITNNLVSISNPAESRRLSWPEHANCSMACLQMTNGEIWTATWMLQVQYSTTKPLAFVRHQLCCKIQEINHRLRSRILESQDPDRFCQSWIPGLVASKSQIFGITKIRWNRTFWALNAKNNNFRGLMN